MPGQKGLDVCVSYVVALDGTLCWAATCLGSRGGIHLIAHFKVKKLLASLGVPHPNSTENCYQPCTDKYAAFVCASFDLCCFGVQRFEIISREVCISTKGVGWFVKGYY